MSCLVASKRGKRKNNGNYHPSRFLRDRDIDIDPEQYLDEAASWLVAEAEIYKDGCRSLTSGNKSRRLRCTCLRVFADPDYGREAAECVADWMLRFEGKKRNEKQEVLIDLMRQHGSGYGARYPLPFEADDDTSQQTIQNLQKAMVCQSTIMKVTDFGTIAWKCCRKHIEDGTLPTHGNKGVSHRRKHFDKEFSTGLNSFFEELRKHSEPTANKPLEDAAGNTETRDDGDVNVEYLPSSFTVRGLYTKYAYENGWVVLSDTKGRINLTAREDPEWKQGGNDGANKIPSLGGFRTYWANNYGNLRIQNPYHICDD